jgi:hypothetical protein
VGSRLELDARARRLRMIRPGMPFTRRLIGWGESRRKPVRSFTGRLGTVRARPHRNPASNSRAHCVTEIQRKLESWATCTALKHRELVPQREELQVQGGA